MGTEFLDIKDLEDAKAIIAHLFTEYYKSGIEETPLERSYGRVIAEAVKSPVDLPPFNRSSRDGYALRAEDTFQATEEEPVILRCIETVEAGSTPTMKVNPGECTRISTGAPVPDGADAVVMVEYTEAHGDDVHIFRPAYPDQHIAERGSDVEKGGILLRAGTVLSADKIATLSAAGITKVPVVSKPVMGVLSTGNELVRPTEELKPGKIYDSNSLGLGAAAEDCGCDVLYGGIVRDSYYKLREAILKLLDDCDILVTSGGTSAGAGDILADVLDELGEVVIHGISIKPGKPTIVGVVRGKLVIGLPGFPVAALIVFKSLIDPELRKLSSKPASGGSVKKLKLGKRFHSSRGRVQYALVKVKDDIAYPVFKDSGAIAALAQSDGYIEIPKNVEILSEGATVEVVLFG